MTLSPVPEADDYLSSEISASDAALRHFVQSPKRKLDAFNQQRTVQASIHNEQDQQQRSSMVRGDSNYSIMPGNSPAEYSLADQETDRSLGNEYQGGGSVVVTVPTMLRQTEEDTTTMTDAADSSYNPNYSIQSILEVNLDVYEMNRLS